MSTQELSSIRVHTIGQYQAAGTALVHAYRHAAHRLIDNRLTRQVGAQKLSQFLTERLNADTERAVALLDRVASGSSKGIEALAGRVAQIELPGVSTLLDAITASQLPLAKVSAKIADTLADGAKKIEARVAETADKVAATDVKDAVEVAVEAAPKKKPARATRKAT